MINPSTSQATKRIQVDSGNRTMSPPHNKIPSAGTNGNIGTRNGR